MGEGRRNHYWKAFNSDLPLCIARTHRWGSWSLGIRSHELDNLKAINIDLRLFRHSTFTQCIKVLQVWFSKKEEFQYHLDNSLPTYFNLKLHVTLTIVTSNSFEFDISSFVLNKLFLTIQFLHPANYPLQRIHQPMI